MRRSVIWLLMGATALVGGWFLAHSEGVTQDAPPLPVGVVDMQRVVQEYKTLAKENETFRAFVQQLDEDLKARYSLRLLPPSEQDEYLDLLKRAPDAKPDERQTMQKRMRELEEKARQSARRFEELSQKQELSEAERQELEAMRKADKETQARLDQLKNEYEQQIQERNKTLSERLDQQIRSAISFIAGKRNLPMVVDRAAVLFGGLDITNDVLSELNKGAS